MKPLDVIVTYVVPILGGLAALASAVLFLGRAVRKRRQQGGEMYPLLSAKAFFTGDVKRGSFESPWVKLRREDTPQGEISRDILAEMEEKLRGTADIIALWGTGGMGKSRALYEFALKRRDLRFINTRGYSAAHPDRLGDAIGKALRRKKVVVLDDLQNFLHLSPLVRDAVYRKRARLLVACRYREHLEEILKDRRFTTELVALGKMQNVSEVVNATGEEKEVIERISQGNPMIAVLAKRYGKDLSRFSSEFDLLDSIVRDMVAAFPSEENGQLVLGTTALRRGVVEDDALVKSHHAALATLAGMQHVETRRVAETAFYYVVPDVVSEHLVRRVFFPKNLLAPDFDNVVRTMPLTDALDVLTVLITMSRGYREPRAPEAARRLFDLLLERPEVRESLEKPKIGFATGDKERAPASGENTALLVAMVLMAFHGFQMIEPVAGMLGQVWQPALMLEHGPLLNDLGTILGQTGFLDQAFKCFEKALDTFRRIGNPAGEASALGNMGNVYVRKGDLDKAFDHYQKGLDIFRRIGNSAGEATALVNMGNVYGRKGDLDKAREHYQKALDSFRQIGNPAGEANALGNMGNVYLSRGDLDKAFDHYQKGLDISRRIGKPEGEATALVNMGNVYLSRGDLDKALDHYQKALDISRRIGNPEGEADALVNMGNVYLSRGDLDNAREHYQKALDIFRRIGNPEGETAARHNIELCQKLRDPSRIAYD